MYDICLEALLLCFRIFQVYGCIQHQMEEVVLTGLMCYQNIA